MNNFFKKIFEKIFCVESSNDSHIKICLLGFIKFSTLKPSYRKRYYDVRRTFNHYKKNNIDITKYPKADGILRDIQLAQVELLKELDYVCKTAGLDYWIDFGTLLGAVRHKGFIPWDDDIDVSMPREFYDKLIEVFEKYKRNKNMQALYYRKANNYSNYFIRIKYKNAPLLLDVFPCDFYGKTLSDEERISKSDFIKAEREKSINKIVRKNRPKDDRIKEMIESFKNKILVSGEFTKESKTDIVWGVDFNHLWKQWFHSFDTIYPLQTIEFEGSSFNCPNNYDKYLKSIYGDYMSYPKDAKHTHIVYRLTEKELNNIKEGI